MTNGPVNVYRVVGYNSTNPDQLPEIMSVPDQFYPILGKIIIQWATMENEAATLTGALMQVNSAVEQNWQTRDFSKRWRLLLEQFAIFVGSEAGLTKEMKEIDRLVKAAKPVRDGIAHKRILMGIDTGGNHLRFEVPQKNNPWSKQYYAASLEKASVDIMNATGRLFRLMNPDHPTSISLPGKSLLQQLPNMDHMTFPMRLKPSRPRPI